MKFNWSYSTLSLILVITLSVLSMVGCSVPQTQIKIATMPEKQKTRTVSYELIRSRETCNAIVTSEIKDSDRFKNSSDLCKPIYDNADVIANGLFSPPALPKGATPDLFMALRVLNSSAVIEGFGSASSACTFNIQIAFGLLDPEKVPILDVVANGQATSDVGLAYKFREVATQRAYDAIAQAMTALGREMSQSREVDFILTNAGVFRLDDQTKTKTLDSLLEDPAKTAALGPMLMAYSIKRKDCSALDSLLRRGVSPQKPYGVERYYPVHWAAIYNNLDALVRLIQEGAAINQRDGSGRLPLYYSAWAGRKEVTEKLLLNSSELDIAKEEYPIESAVILESFGDYYVSLWEKERARRSYGLARDLLVRTSADYGMLSTDVSWKKFWRYIGIGLLAGTQSYLQSANAQLQQRQFNQMAALRHANETGANYYKSLDYLNKNPVLTAQPQPQAFLTQKQIETTDLDERKKVLDQLKTLAEAQAAQIERKLTALDKAAGYNEFKETVQQ